MTGIRKYLTKMVESHAPKALQKMFLPSYHIAILNGVELINSRVMKQILPKSRDGEFSVQKIGVGGSCEVYLTEMNENSVVVKLMKTIAMNWKEQLEAEIEFLAVVKHEAIVRLVGVYKSRGSRGPALVLEHVGGLLPWPQKMQILREIAHGLAFIHAQHYILRDLKSDNVMVTHDRHAKLCDFGAAIGVGHSPRFYAFSLGYVDPQVGGLGTKVRKDKKNVPTGPTEEEIREMIFEIFKVLDFTTARFTDVINQLGERFNVDLKPRGSAIRILIEEELEKFVEGVEEEEEKAEPSLQLM